MLDALEALDALRDDEDGWEPDPEMHPARIILYAIAVAAAPAIVEQASIGFVRICRGIGEAVRRARLPRPEPVKKKGARRGDKTP